MIQINITNEQLPELARLIATSPGIAQLVASQLREQPETYTVQEAAKALGVSTKTIRRRIEAKVLPIVPNIGAVRIPAQAIQRALNPHRE